MSKKIKKKIKYQRVLVKLSGESFQGPRSAGIHFPTVNKIVEEIYAIHKLGVEVAVVVGAGNLFRGSEADQRYIDRASADYMGMIATMLNGIALKRAFEQKDVASHLVSPIEIRQISEFYNIFNTNRYLKKKEVVVLAGGTGSPYFTTDTAAALRAIELKVDIFFKATKVDGIYSSDPLKNKKAKKFSQISFRDALLKNVKVMDSTAFSLCMDNNLPIAVFKFKPGVLKAIVTGQEGVGTIVNN